MNVYRTTVKHDRKEDRVELVLSPNAPRAAAKATALWRKHTYHYEPKAVLVELLGDAVTAGKATV